MTETGAMKLSSAIKDSEEVVVERFEAYGQCRDSRRIAGLEKRLDEAKEIIKTFCGLCDVFNSSNGSFDNLIAKAEAF